MASTVFPAPSGGASPIKSIQRGYASAAGNVTITAISTSKSSVRSFGTSSSGNVSTTRSNGIDGVYDSYANPINFGNTFVSGNYGAYLQDSTTLVVTGPCHWEVVEFN
jgi:hypothetical protein